MITPNSEKQAEKLLITPVRNWKSIDEIADITGHDVPNQLLRMNHNHFILRINHKQIVPEI